MVKNESSCLNFKLVNIFVILMFLICSSIFYGIYYVFSIVSNVNAMSVAFPALRAIVEQVPERLVVLDKNGNYNGQIVLDLSWDKEFTLISKKMLKDGQPKNKFVVDLGAFDGKLSSNAYNFFQCGWDGLLVEASSANMKLTKQHTQQFLEHGQNIKYEQVAVVAETKQGESKSLKLHLGANPTEHSLIPSRLGGSSPKAEKDKEGQFEYVDKVPVKTLLERNKVPKEFGVFTVDIEGADQEAILCKVIARYGYRPQYIIAEIHRMPRCVLDLYEIIGHRRYNWIVHLKK